MVMFLLVLQTHSSLGWCWANGNQASALMKVHYIPTQQELFIFYETCRAIGASYRRHLLSLVIRGPVARGQPDPGDRFNASKSCRYEVPRKRFHIFIFWSLQRKLEYLESTMQPVFYNYNPRLQLFYLDFFLNALQRSSTYLKKTENYIRFYVVFFVCLFLHVLRLKYVLILQRWL